LYKIIPNLHYVGKELIFLPSCRSTNSYIKDLLRQKEIVDGTVVIAHAQTAGRGQIDSKWEANAGENITLSILLNPPLDLSNQYLLNMAVACGVHSCIQHFIKNKTLQVCIKWPNDLMIDDKKVSGILIENSIRNNRIGSSIIGIGINVNQISFTIPHASSLKNVLHQSITLEEVYQILLIELDKYLSLLLNNRSDDVFDYYNNHIYLKNKLIKIQQANSVFWGSIKSVGTDGRIQINCEGELKSFLNKEISYGY
jgi:BirA family biotin operon repressor/biotin-[acetyl-CoA-carboxylase] ligase